MAQLDGLIKELCPNGVEYKKLSDVLTIRNGKDYKGFAEGSIPVYGSGGIMTYIDHFAYDKPSVLIPRKGSLDKLYYVDVPFWTVDTIFYTVGGADKILDYADRPSFCLYSSGLSPPRDILIRFSRYQTI